MRTSLYDALEVNSSSSTDAIKAALRTVVRRFWAVPRDASGDSEEAIRFAAIAASILVDPIRRTDYDAALNPGVGAGPWRMPIASRDAGNDGRTHSHILADAEGGVSQLSIVGVAPSALPGVDALAQPLPDGKAWASPLLLVALAASGVLLWFALTRPFPDWFELSIIQALLASIGVLVAVLGLAAGTNRRQEASIAAAGLSRLAIIKWRREGSIFLGSPPPQHDTAWIFKLRLMELTRSAAGFVTSASPWRRLAARLADYALIGIALYYGVVLIDHFVPIFDAGFILVRSLLVLPTLVAVLAIPFTALLHRLFGNTPGKWLFSLQVVTGITRPADHFEPTDRALLWSRATRVAWRGSALGIWPIALLLLPRNLTLARDTETDWEASGDSLVMARPMTTSAVATGVIILLASVLILVAGWRRDYVEIWPRIVSSVASAQAIADAVFVPNAKATQAESVASPALERGDAAAAQPANSSLWNRLLDQLNLTKSESKGDATTIVVATTPKADVAVTKLAPPPTTSAEAEMSKQAIASQARRLRIDGYARQAAVARRSGNYGALQGSCQRWTQDQPGSSEAWRCFGLAQFQNGEGQQGLAALRQALKLEPNDATVESAILSILRP